VKIYITSGETKMIESANESEGSIGALFPVGFIRGPQYVVILQFHHEGSQQGLQSGSEHSIAGLLQESLGKEIEGLDNFTPDFKVRPSSHGLLPLMVAAAIVTISPSATATITTTPPLLPFVIRCVWQFNLFQ
jgi:hypothetical protein